MNTRARVVTVIAVLVSLGSLGGAFRAAADQAQAHDNDRYSTAGYSTAGYSAAGLYNLGNTYARSNKPALAVLNYERARVLSPMNSDIRANLHSVREKAGIPAQTESGMSQWGRMANPNTMYWLGLFGLTLAGTCFLMRRLRSDHRLALTTAGVAGLLLTSLSVWNCVATMPTLSESVVMQPAAATASPVSGADPLFTVPQAEIVSVHDEHQGFVLIRDSLGREGWVAGSKLIAIIPRSAASVGRTT